MLSRRNQGKNSRCGVFATSMRAKEALAKYGQENVINGTIGSLYREDEK